MVVDLKKYMTDDEQELISQILEKAEKRMKQQQQQQSNVFSYLNCQCEVYEQMPEDRKKLEGSCMADMQQLLGMVCQFCRDHGCCRCSWRGDEREEEEDEDALPF